MKKIISGKRYDTETARKIGTWSSEGSRRDFGYYEETLYQKRTGEYFLHGEGGPASPYSKKAGQSEWRGGEDIQIMTTEEARQWAEAHLDPDVYEAEFGAENEDAGREVLVSVGQKIRAAREAAGMTQTELAERIGIAQSKVATYEAGSVDLSLVRLCLIAEALGTTADKLLE